MSRTCGHGRLTQPSRHAFRANFRQPPAKKTSSSARDPTVALVRSLTLQSIAQFELQQVGQSITSGFRSVCTAVDGVVDGGQGERVTTSSTAPCWNRFFIQFTPGPAAESSRMIAFSFVPGPTRSLS